MNPKRPDSELFLRTCLDGFIANEEKAANRIKRGGGVKTFSLDFEAVENELQILQINDEESADDYFDKEWQRSLFALSVEELKKQCHGSGKSIHFEIFLRYDLNESASSAKLSYEDLAAEFNIPTTQVTNYLAYARRELRGILLDKLKELTISEDEFQSEARALLGIDLK